MCRPVQCGLAVCVHFAWMVSANRLSWNLSTTKPATRLWLPEALHRRSLNSARVYTNAFVWINCWLSWANHFICTIRGNFLVAGNRKDWNSLTEFDKVASHRLNLIDWSSQSLTDRTRLLRAMVERWQSLFSLSSRLKETVCECKVFAEQLPDTFRRANLPERLAQNFNFRTSELLHLYF